MNWDARLVSLQDKAASQKRYEQQRNATRVSLMGEHARSRNLKNEETPQSMLHESRKIQFGYS